MLESLAPAHRTRPTQQQPRHGSYYIMKDTSEAHNKSSIKHCTCPGSEPGKIIADPRAHEPGCRFRKIKTVDVHLPTKIDDGYQLGLAL